MAPMRSAGWLTSSPSDFESIEVEGRHKTISGSDGDYRLGLLAGSAFAGGQRHLVSSFGHARRKAIALVARDWAVRPYAENTRGGWTGTGRPGVLVPLQAFANTAGGCEAAYRSWVCIFRGGFFRGGAFQGGRMRIFCRRRSRFLNMTSVCTSP